MLSTSIGNAPLHWSINVFFTGCSYNGSIEYIAPLSLKLEPSSTLESAMTTKETCPQGLIDGVSNKTPSNLFRSSMPASNKKAQSQQPYKLSPPRSQPKSDLSSELLRLRWLVFFSIIYLTFSFGSCLHKSILVRRSKHSPQKGRKLPCSFPALQDQ